METTQVTSLIRYCIINNKKKHKITQNSKISQFAEISEMITE